VEFERAPFVALLERYLASRALGVEWEAVAAAPAAALINSLCMVLPFQPIEKQALLEAPGPAERRTMLTALLAMGAAEPAPADEDDDDEPPVLQ
jgi:Lon protease-like protein